MHAAHWLANRKSNLTPLLGNSRQHYVLPLSLVLSLVAPPIVRCAFLYTLAPDELAERRHLRRKFRMHTVQIMFNFSTERN